MAEREKLASVGPVRTSTTVVLVSKPGAETLTKALPGLRAEIRKVEKDSDDSSKNPRKFKPWTTAHQSLCEEEDKAAPKEEASYQKSFVSIM